MAGEYEIYSDGNISTCVLPEEANQSCRSAVIEKIRRLSDLVSTK